MRPTFFRAPLPRPVLFAAVLMLGSLAARATMVTNCVAPLAYALTYARPASAPAKRSGANDLLDISGVGNGVTNLLNDGSRWVSLHGLTLRANHGNRAAQYELGVRDALGIGFSQNDAAAAQWFQIAAARGGVRAINDLGVLHAEGHGVPLSYRNAAHWFELATQQGYAAAQFNLGVMFARGRGVAQAPSLAAVWFKRAAEQGFVPAQLALGNLLDHGAPGLGRNLPWRISGKSWPRPRCPRKTSA
ncbi:MAG: tetratricopeptide repeat protein [Metallibacterium sp.]